MAKSFEELLFEGAMTAVRTLTLEELNKHMHGLDAMNLPEDVAEFPRIVLTLAIAEKQNLRAMN